MNNKFTKEKVEEKLNHLSKIKFDNNKPTKKETAEKILFNLKKKEKPIVKPNRLTDKYKHYEDNDKDNVIVRNK